MKQITLGTTGITVPQNAFGALPIQRVSADEAVRLLRRAREGGMRFFDTARAYTDSEEKLGLAFGGQWDGLYVATKTAAKTPEALRADLETSLRLLQRDYIDIYQFHMAGQCYRPGDGTGMYEAMLEAKAQGKIRHIGITAHKIGVAEDIIASGLYETLQYPFSYLSTPREAALAESCRKANMGLIAMKALAGGLVTNADAAFAYIAQYDNRAAHLGHPASDGAGAVARLLPGARLPDAGAAQLHREGARRADGRILPRLRLLPALPGRDPDQPVRAHLPDDPPRAVRELAGSRHAGRNGEDRALPRLWPVQEPLSL